MSKKYQVFVSSTYIDLVDEREQIIRACLEMGHIPVGMEMFSAADEEQWKIIQRQIDEIDYYVILLAHRYGSTTDEGVSYTEKEYDYAVSKGIPVLGFVIDDGAAWPADRIDNEEDKKFALVDFKEKVKSKSVNFWSNKDELHAKFSIALMKAIVNNPRSGWMKSDDSVGPEVMKELSRLSSENSSLREEITALKQKKIEVDDQSKEIIGILQKNNKPLYVWYSGDKGWEDREPEQTSLLKIFEAVAPNLLVENHNMEIARDVAFFLGSDEKFRHDWPVPSNHVSHWLTDFHALDLVEPSKKKHPVADGKDYWTLTKKGRSVIASVRKLKLIAGIAEKEEAPEDV
ncbi:MAG: DUF4062 domain-containing protein [Pseudomonadales bacterium]|nr:DUF4062 domain-containing protein [Pseudomonadales bacterium]